MINNKLIEEFKKKGFLKINSFFKKSDINKAKKKIDHIYGLKNKGTLWALHNKDIFFLKLICKKKIQNIIIPLLNDPYYKKIPSSKPNYILSEYIGINQTNPLHLHIDSWMPSSSEKTWMLQLAILLDDRNKKNGCTTYVKNSHRSDKYADRSLKNVSYLEGKIGDLIIWDSRLWHGRTKSKFKSYNSWALIATFQSWFLKQRFDYTKSIPKKIYSKLTKIEKQIIGFCSIPPKNEKEGFNPRNGYESLK